MNTFKRALTLTAVSAAGAGAALWGGYEIKQERETGIQECNEDMEGRAARECEAAGRRESEIVKWVDENDERQSLTYDAVLNIMAGVALVSTLCSGVMAFAKMED